MWTCPHCNQTIENIKSRGGHVASCGLNPFRRKPKASVKRHILIQVETTCLRCKQLISKQTDNRQEFCKNCLRSNGGFAVSGLKKTCSCIDCSTFVVVSVKLRTKYVRCLTCKELYKESLKKRARLTSIRQCKICNCSFEGVTAEFCVCCRQLRYQEIGKKSAQKQSKIRRSKNEMFFADLCVKRFSNVTFNDPIFDGWDADVLVHDLKIAVFWNGPWHYRKITRKHSLEQVQNRDRLKKTIIVRHGWKIYEIRDDKGKFNEFFVKEKFEQFISELDLIEPGTKTGGAGEAGHTLPVLDLFFSSSRGAELTAAPVKQSERPLY